MLRFAAPCRDFLRLIVPQTLQQNQHLGVSRLIAVPFRYGAEPLRALTSQSKPLTSYYI